MDLWAHGIQACILHHFVEMFFRPIDELSDKGHEQQSSVRQLVLHS